MKVNTDGQRGVTVGQRTGQESRAEQQWTCCVDQCRPGCEPVGRNARDKAPAEPGGLRGRCSTSTWIHSLSSPPPLPPPGFSCSVTLSLSTPTPLHSQTFAQRRQWENSDGSRTMEVAFVYTPSLPFSNCMTEGLGGGVWFVLSTLHRNGGPPPEYS